MNIHREYQLFCFKYLNEMENSVITQMKCIAVEKDETAKACFSMLDDLISYDSKCLEDFQKLSKEGNSEGDPSPTVLASFLNLMAAKEKKLSKHRHSLYELETKKILLDFSFSKQSKFLDLYSRLTQGKGHPLRHLLGRRRLPLPSALHRFEPVVLGALHQRRLAEVVHPRPVAWPHADSRSPTSDYTR